MMYHLAKKKNYKDITVTFENDEKERKYKVNNAVLKCELFWYVIAEDNIPADENITFPFDRLEAFDLIHSNKCLDYIDSLVEKLDTDPDHEITLLKLDNLRINLAYFGHEEFIQYLDNFAIIESLKAIIKRFINPKTKKEMYDLINKFYESWGLYTYVECRNSLISNLKKIRAGAEVGIKVIKSNTNYIIKRYDDIISQGRHEEYEAYFESIYNKLSMDIKYICSRVENILSESIDMELRRGCNL